MSLKESAEAVSLCVQAGQSVLVWGPPGVGKTSVISQIAETLDVALFETLIASVRDPIDFGGLMVPTPEGVRLAAMPWAARVARVASENPEKKVVVFLDEITTAAPAVQAALLRVILDKVVGDLYLGDNVTFVAAANPPEEAANGSDACAPLANRVCHLAWDLDTAAWCDGVVSGFPAPPVLRLPGEWFDNIPSARNIVSGFIRVNPGKLHMLPKDDVSRGRAWPSPRTWDMLATLMAAAQSAGASAEVTQQLVMGCVGAGVAMEFLSWRRNLDLPDPEDIIKNPATAALPKRGDQAWVIVGAVGQAAILKSKEHSARWHAALVYLDRVALAKGDDIIIPTLRRMITGDAKPRDGKLSKEMAKRLGAFFELPGR